MSKFHADCQFQVRSEEGNPQCSRNFEIKRNARSKAEEPQRRENKICYSFPTNVQLR